MLVRLVKQFVEYHATSLEFVTPKMLSYQIIRKTPKNYILKRDIDYINPYRLVRNALYIPYCLGYITSLEIALRNTRTYMHDFQLGIKI